MAKSTTSMKRKPRRNPEELLVDLEKKKERLEKRVFKKNMDTIFEFGMIVLKAAGTNVAELSDNLKKPPREVKATVRGIIESALRTLEG